MSCSVSPMGIVTIIVVPLHVSRTSDPGDEEPKSDAGEDTLPHGPVGDEPHFLIEVVDLLQSLDIVLSHGRIRNGPQTEVVHVG